MLPAQRCWRSCDLTCQPRMPSTSMLRSQKLKEAQVGNEKYSINPDCIILCEQCSGCGYMTA